MPTSFLINDRAKFAALLVGITSAVFLMLEMTSLFCGNPRPCILNSAQHWCLDLGVMDPAVQIVAISIPLPDSVLGEVRSIPAVKYALPLYPGGALLKFPEGIYQAANVVGLDDTSLLG